MNELPQQETVDTSSRSQFLRRHSAIIAVALLLSFVCVGIVATVVMRRASQSVSPAPQEPSSSNPVYDGYMIAEREHIDALDRTVHNELTSFTNWLNRGEAKGMIGEIGWPGSGTADYDRWSALANAWMTDIRQTDMKVLYWATGRHWSQNYPLSAFETANDQLFRPNAQALSIEATLPKNGLGINLAGLEFSVEDPFSAATPGVEGTNYFKTKEEDFSFLAGRGYTIIRLPFRWERLQPQLNGPFEPTYLSYLQEAVAHAKKYNLEIILDMHNYGEYRLAKGTTLYLGSNELTYAHFTDVWVKLSSTFKGSESDLYYGLMNEPRGLPKGAAANPARNWESASQTALTAIRGNNDNRPILVAGYNWSKVKTWTQQHPTPWINDPANNFYYEGHHYWDADETGTYQKSYNEALQKVR